MTQNKISPLRRRMIEDMIIRKLGEKTQKGYIRAVRNFTRFLKRSPETATPEDIRRFFLHLEERGTGTPTRNNTVSALRFLFATTLDRHDLFKHLRFVHEPRKLPVVLSRDEVARLIECAPGPGLKYKAALSVAYGAGLRASELVRLKVSDIDSDRMIIKVEQGKGRKDRFVMLSPHLLDLLRAWWLQSRSKGWLFPGREPGNHVTTRQLSRVCRMAVEMAEIKKRVSLHTLRHSFATHLLEQNVDIRIIQVLMGHAKLDSTALYTQVATKTIREVMSPFEVLALKKKELS